METITIIDFGSQVTKLIARRVRENGVYSEIIPCNSIEIGSPKAIILSGSPSSVEPSKYDELMKKVTALNSPILGICFGQQLLCSYFGGKVETSDKREYGKTDISITNTSPLFSKLWQKNNSYPVWMSHGDKVVEISDNFQVIAETPSAPYAAIADETRKIYGLQFHPEVVHTPQGGELIKNFLYNIAGCSGNWNMHSFKEDAIKKIREQVGDKKVICGVSGGVDSSVVARLIYEAIGEQLTCIFVDNGLLRHKEAEQVINTFKNDSHFPLLKHTDATDLFLSRLKEVFDPEQKRKIIGKTFIDVFEKEANKINGAEFLAQGTLYPDVIESVSATGGPSVTIKSHHNVGGLPDTMNLKLIEPVRELFKDEVRELGRELNMPDEMIDRHPFPGPGLAIRVLGEITKEKLDILRKADNIFITEIKKAGLYDEIWQAFAVLLPVRTVGVMGDGRSYDFVCSLRAVTAIDGMTADFYRFDTNLLADISNKITNEVKGINRVTYDITSKPPATIEWE